MSESPERVASPTQAHLVDHYRHLREKLEATTAAHKHAFEMCEEAETAMTAGGEVQEEWENVKSMAQEALSLIVQGNASLPQLRSICSRYFALLKTHEGSHYVKCLRETEQTARDMEVLTMTLNDFRNSHTTSLWREVDPLKQNPKLKAVFGASRFWNELGAACDRLAVAVDSEESRDSALARYILVHRQVLLKLDAMPPIDLCAQSSTVVSRHLVAILSETGRETLVIMRDIKAIACARPSDDVFRGFADYLRLPPQLLTDKAEYRKRIFK